MKKGAFKAVRILQIPLGLTKIDSYGKPITCSLELHDKNLQSPSKTI
jgi:hypothetical protein